MIILKYLNTKFWINKYMEKVKKINLEMRFSKINILKFSLHEASVSNIQSHPIIEFQVKNC